MRSRTVIGSLLTLVGAGAVLARTSPRPAVRIVRFIFDQTGIARNTLLGDEVPVGITSRVAIQYGEQADELLDVHRPADAGPAQLPTIVWIHGGGWVSGGRTQVANYLKILAHAGFTVVGVDYSIAPAATFPTPVRQVNASLAYLVDHAQDLGIDPDRIVLAGDSAGAQIAAQVALLTTSAAFAGQLDIAPALTPHQLRGTLLYSGPYDRSIGSDRGLARGFVRATMWAYTGAREYRSDEALNGLDVIDQLTDRFPPSFVSVGNADPLAPHSYRFADRLAELGVDVTPMFFDASHRPALPHVYQFLLDMPEARDALVQSVEFVTRVTE